MEGFRLVNAISTATAAERWEDLSEALILEAIKAHRITAVMEGGRYFISPWSETELRAFARERHLGRMRTAGAPAGHGKVTA